MYFVLTSAAEKQVIKGVTTAAYTQVRRGVVKHKQILYHIVKAIGSVLQYEVHQVAHIHDIQLVESLPGIWEMSPITMHSVTFPATSEEDQSSSMSLCNHNNSSKGHKQEHLFGATLMLFGHSSS